MLNDVTTCNDINAVYNKKVHYNVNGLNSILALNNCAL